MVEERKGSTFGSIRSFVVSAEPLQILVFYPRHPLVVLVAVAGHDPFGVGLLALLIVGEAVVHLALLVFGWFGHIGGWGWVVWSVKSEGRYVGGVVE